MTPQRTAYAGKTVTRNGSLFLSADAPLIGRRPTILVPGMPAAGDTAAPYLARWLTNLPTYVDNLNAIGRPVIVCFSGLCFGASVSSSAGAVGRNVIDDAITWATALGCDTTTVDVIGISHGGIVAFNWAHRNLARLNRLWLHSPGWSLAHLYAQDPTSEAAGLGKISDAMKAVFGTVDLPTTLAASADVDPARNRAALELIADRTATVIAVNDDTVGITELIADHEATGTRLRLLPGGAHWFAHWFTGWSDFAPAQWFTAA